MSELLLYASASALLIGLLPNFMKMGGRRAAPSVSSALFATVAFLFAVGQAVLYGTIDTVITLSNASFVNLLLSGVLRAAVCLCLFTALSTGGVNRVMPMYFLADGAAIVVLSLLSGGRLNIWRLCCIVILLLGIVLMESRQSKGRGYKWLLFSCLTMLLAAGKTLFDARYLPSAGSASLVVETLASMLVLWILAAVGKSLKGLGKLKMEDWLFLILAGMSIGLSWLCDGQVDRLGDSSYLLPIQLLSFPLMMLFARILQKERMPGAAVLGLVLAVLGQFGLQLGL